MAAWLVAALSAPATVPPQSTLDDVLKRAGRIRDGGSNGSSQSIVAEEQYLQ